MKKLISKIVCTVLALGCAAPHAYAVDAESLYGSGNTPEEARQDSDLQYIFRVKDSEQSYVLLDSSDDGYLVIADRCTAGNVAFDDSKSGVSNIFDTERESCIAYKINQESYISANIPQAVADHITERDWDIEAGYNVEARTVHAKIALLSAEEYAKYIKRIGYSTGDSVDWLLRTPYPQSQTTSASVAVASTTTTQKTAGRLVAVSGYYFNTRHIRPVFKLDADFFGEVGLDVSVTGDAIFDLLREKYTKDDLSSLYTDEELEDIGYAGKIVPKAENVTLRGGATVLYPLDLSYNYTHEENTPEGESIKNWYISSTLNGTYSRIEGADGMSYTVSAQDSGKYVYAEVIPVDENGVQGRPVKSNTIGPIPASLGPVGNQPQVFDGEKEQTPPENVFRVDNWDNEFILLDSTDDDASKFFVMAKASYGVYAYDTQGHERFDPENENNVGYYLNHDFLASTNTNPHFPLSLTPHIDMRHEWVTEAGNASGDASGDYIFNAGVTLISYNEWKKYYAKIGYDDGMNMVGWWFRTAKGTEDHYGDMLAVRTAMSSDFNGRAFQYGGKSALIVRPVFYLDRSFFTDVRVNTEDLGENVKSIICREYSMDELMSGRAAYTEEELEKLGYSQAPSAQSMGFSGFPAVGGRIEAAYKYSGQPEGDSIVKWYTSSVMGGSYTETGINKKTIDIGPELAGKYLKYTVIPVDNTGMGGRKRESADIGPIRPEQNVSAGTLEIKNASGKVPDLSKDTQISISCELNKADAEGVVLVAGLYKENGEIIKLMSERTEQSGRLSVTLNRNAYDGAAVLRAALMYEDGMRPVVIKTIE